MDLGLLRSFVSVVDAGGFTRAGERVHRTQSTVSQQIRRLEDSVGRKLLLRKGKQVSPTDEGEQLLTYARRMLALADEARDAMGRPAPGDIVRLGVPEDFAAYRLAQMLSKFARSHPNLRLDVRCDLSVRLRRDLARGEFDVALIKRYAGDASETGAVAAWPERLRWVASRRFPVDLDRDPLPLAMFEQGCLYRRRAIHLLEAAGRAWRVAYMSPNLAGIQAAVSVGLGVSILQDVAVLADHRVLGPKEGFPKLSKTELALVVRSEAPPAARRLADLLAEFCKAAAARAAA
jgi:DNA-binding transcriptional LysR family regulator